jgi:hypothetical protein
MEIEMPIRFVPLDGRAIDVWGPEDLRALEHADDDDAPADEDVVSSAESTRPKPES